jgi:hypothetical protein
MNNSQVVNLSEVYGCLEAVLGEQFDSGNQRLRAIKGDLLAAASALHRQNQRQWDLEDIAHTAGVHNGRLAELKRSIDESNAVRIQKINTIDGCLSELLAEFRHVSEATTTGTTYASESVGQILDRLSIAYIRTAKESNPKRHDSSRQLHNHLISCLRTTMELIPQRRIVLPPGRIKKVYPQEDADGAA